jgi:hypothetical protein
VVADFTFTCDSGSLVACCPKCSFLPSSCLDLIVHRLLPSTIHHTFYISNSNFRDISLSFHILCLVFRQQNSQSTFPDLRKSHEGVCVSILKPVICVLQVSKASPRWADPVLLPFFHQWKRKWFLETVEICNKYLVCSASLSNTHPFP